MSWLITLISGLFSGLLGLRQKRLEAQATIDAKSVVDGTSINNHLWQRLDALEKRLSDEEQRGNRIERRLERVCWGYEDLRRNVLKVVRALRTGQPVRDDLLDELEATPNIQELLKNPVDDN